MRTLWSTLWGISRCSSKIVQCVPLRRAREDEQSSHPGTSSYASPGICRRYRSPRHCALISRNDTTSSDLRTWTILAGYHRCPRTSQRRSELDEHRPAVSERGKRGGYLRGARSRELHRGRPYLRDTVPQTQKHPDNVSQKLTQGRVCVHAARGEDLPDSTLKSAV